MAVLVSHAQKKQKTDALAEFRKSENPKNKKSRKKIKKNKKNIKKMGVKKWYRKRAEKNT